MSDPYHLDAHTRAKHMLLEKYLGGWVPILGKISRDLVYVDGFAFAGRYTSGGVGGAGGPGSPLIAIDVVRRVDPNARGIFFFIEHDAETCRVLKANVAELPVRQRDGSREPDEVRVWQGRFDERVRPVLDRLEAKKPTPPSFFFVDPYGLKGVSMPMIRRIMAIPKAEVFINLMWVRSALSMTKAYNDDAGLCETLDEVFGTPDWRQLWTLPTPERFRNGMRDLFIKRCRDKDGANAKYVRSFAVHRSDTGELVYWMIFCTNSLKGMEVMKNAMWTVDPTGTFRYGDRTSADQEMLFTLQDAATKLPALLQERFRGLGPVEVGDIEEFVIADTPFRKADLRKHALEPMEDAGMIRVARPSGSTRGYKDGTAITFL